MRDFRAFVGHRRCYCFFIRVLLDYSRSNSVGCTGEVVQGDLSLPLVCDAARKLIFSVVGDQGYRAGGGEGGAYSFVSCPIKSLAHWLRISVETEHRPYSYQRHLQHAGGRKVMSRARARGHPLALP